MSIKKLCQVPLGLEDEKVELIIKKNSSVFLDSGQLIFNENSDAIFDTYFAAFSIGKWNNLCTIKSLSLNLEFEGKLLVKVRNIEPGYDIRDHQEYVIESNKLSKKSLHIDSFEALEGLLTFEIFCLSDNAKIVDIFWGTGDSIKNRDTKLAMVITTFNRQEAVQQAVERIIKGLTGEIPYHVYVVDNGSNLELDESEHLTLIPNRNYGGAGGFSRGLVEVIDSGAASHCLFMDDDASCDVESILRSFRLFSMVDDVECAVAGAMLLENNPYKQHECGALFDGMCQPLKHGLDLRDLGALVENERHEHIDYGGWWFFMFPVASVKELAFPFFVRGDDSNFSMQHSFTIVTLNGVGSWQDDFSHKSGPMTEYLDLRYHLVHRINIEGLDDSLLSMLKIVWRFIMKDNNKYCYASARASCIAFNDFMEGPLFFEENLDTSEIRRKIGKLSIPERPAPMEKPEVTKKTNKWYLTKLAAVLRPLTFNGHLVPKVFFINDNILAQRSYGAQKGTFLTKNVTFYYDETKQGVILQHSKKKYFFNVLVGILLSIKCAFLLPYLRKKYRNEYNQQVSISSWKKRYQ